MKSFFTLLFICFLATSKAQHIPKHAIAIIPVILEIKKDTAYSVTWKVSDINRDTLLPASLFVYLLNRTGGRVYEYEIVLPASIVRKWGSDNTLIDDYVFITNKALIKK